MWTAENRPRYNRETLRYASDLTDEVRAHVEPLISPGKRGGGKRLDMREVVNVVVCILSIGYKRHYLPKDMPPRSTAQNYLSLWTWAGTPERINDALVMRDRDRVGREASPTAGIIDRRWVETTEPGGPRGFDAGKKVKDRKRHILIGTGGHLLGASVHGADTQDRDGATLRFCILFGLFPCLQKFFADAGYAGEKAAKTIATFGAWVLQIVKGPADAQGFHVPPRRWVVERTFAWLCRSRRLAKDFETLTTSAKGGLYATSIMLLHRRLGQTT